MTREDLKKGNIISDKIDDINSFLDLKKSNNSKVTITVEGSESNMGSNFTRSISFKWGSDFGTNLKQLIEIHHSDLIDELEKL